MLCVNRVVFVERLVLFFASPNTVARVMIGLYWQTVGNTLWCCRVLPVTENHKSISRALYSVLALFVGRRDARNHKMFHSDIPLSKMAVIDGQRGACRLATEAGIKQHNTSRSGRDRYASQYVLTRLSFAPSRRHINRSFPSAFSTFAFPYGN